MSPAARSLASLVALLPVLPLLAACYAYTEAVAPPPPGANVRVELTREGVFLLEDIGMDVDGTLEGRLLEGSPDSVRVSILTGREASVFRGEREFRSSVYLPRTAVVSLETRSLSWPRTLLVTGLAAGATAALVGDVVAGGDNDGDGGGGGPPTAAVGIRIPVGFGLR